MRLGWPLLLLTLALAACGKNESRRVIVLGVDGMDPGFLERHWNALPHLQRLREQGGLLRLATTSPPQSPVAWATFITGLDSTQHGIFDFVHRDPVTMQPLSSFAETLGPAHTWRMGPYLLPLSGARVRSFRQGRTFWEILTEHNIAATIVRMPTNYPPQQNVGQALAGMGTPDLEGTFGTFTYYTDDPGETARTVSGGRIVPVVAENGRAILPVAGPPNVLRGDRAETSVNMIADVDAAAGAARFEVAGQQFILKEGEWSGWVRVRFPLIRGLRGVSGMFRIYARQLRPAIHIYRSPLNIDPADPALPVSAPPEYAADLVRRIGPFYTQGIEEDTSALRQGALDLGEYLQQSRFVARQRRALLRECLRQFHGGLLFFYFSETDQDSHMLWGKHQDELLKTYQGVDEAVGEVLDTQRGATVVVMSDHGFARFERGVNLNSWLRSEGFATKAYALGLNSLYLRAGVDRESTLTEIEKKLAAWRDDKTGARVIGETVRLTGATSKYAPNLVVGPAAGYRISWETALGGAPAALLEDNTDAWIGDHCMAAKDVPGVLLGTLRPQAADPALKDLPVSILGLFGVPAPAEMKGRDLWRNLSN